VVYRTIELKGGPQSFSGGSQPTAESALMPPMPAAAYRVNRAQSLRRAVRLQSYLTEKVWNPATSKSWKSFCCEFKTGCRDSATQRGAAFLEAQGHAVGPYYDLSTLVGVPHRVLIVPMEVGGGRDKVTGEEPKFADVEGRTAGVHRSSLLAFSERNAHMQGVTLALQLAFGLPVGGPERLSLANGGSVHVFDAFAMTNLLMCSSVAKEDSQSSKSTATMRKSCATHLVETVGILQPTLVISQGWGLVDTLRDALGVTHTVDLGLEKCYLSYCDLDGQRFVWLALYHPTRFWSSPNQTYFKETVAPAMKEARQRALRLARKTAK